MNRIAIIAGKSANPAIFIVKRYKLRHSAASLFVKRILFTMSYRNLFSRSAVIIAMA